MPRRRPSADPLDVLGEFATRLQRTADKPNVYRYKPQPYQELFHQSQSKGRIAIGGNRSGKTHSTVADDILIITRRHPYRQHLYPPTGIPMKMRLIGTDFDRGVGQALLPYVKQFLPMSFLRNGSWEDSYRQSEHLLRLDDDSEISFMSYEQDPDKFQAVALHHAHFDEEPPKAIFDETMLRLVDYAGSWTLSETPVQQMEWVQDELIEPWKDGLRPDLSVHQYDTRQNVHLPPDEVQKLVSNLSVADALIRLQGQYSNSSLVFPEFTRKWPNVIPQEGFRLTPEWRVYESMDHGYVNPTAWLWTAVHEDGSIVTFDSLYAKEVTVDTWASFVKQRRREIADRFGLSQETFAEMLGGTFGDPAIGDQGNATAQTGITIQQAYALGGVFIATDGIRSARHQNQNIGLDKMHTYLSKRPVWHPTKPEEPWWQLTDNNQDLITELKQARKPRQTLTGREVKNEGEQIRDKNNHAIDAAKYLFIVTHDLRPEAYRAAEEKREQELAREVLRPVPTQFETHDAIFGASNVSGWTISESDAYPVMED